MPDRSADTPSMAALLQVANVNDIKSYLMGESRCLRNWLIHPIATAGARPDPGGAHARHTFPEEPRVGCSALRS